MNYLTNAFSLNMLDGGDFLVQVEQIEISTAVNVLESCTSIVGHADTASVFSEVLGTTVESNRTSVSLKSGDMMIVGQYKGPRLPEGAHKLPEGATIEWLRVTVTSMSETESDSEPNETRGLATEVSSDTAFAGI